MDTKQLKPCPFCGSEAELIHGDGPFAGRVQIDCANCRTATWWWEEAVAVRSWNARVTLAPSDAAQAPNELPAWFSQFLTNVCEIPDRNSPEGEPDAVVATLEELKQCAVNAIEAQGESASCTAEAAALQAYDRSVKDGFSHDCESYCAGHIDRQYAAPVAAQAPSDAQDAARYRLIRAGFGDFGPDADLHNAFVDGGEKLDAALDKLLPAAAPVAPAAAAPELVVSAGDLDFTPDEQHSICDMANIGKALLERISSMYPDYVWNESPTEIVSDLINERDDKRANYDRIRHGLARWAAQSWSDEVRNRPLINVHRRALDDTWRQVIRYCGADDVAMLVPTHGDLVAVASTPIVAPAAAQERPDSMPPFSEVVEHAQDDARPALGAAAVERLQSTPLANVARAASTPSNTGELIRQINGGGTEPIASPLWAAYDALRAIIHALDAGQDAALILDENSPLVDGARSALAARAAAASPLHFELRFPATLRKMWSGREVQSWLDELPPLYEVPTHAQDGNNGNTSPIEGAAPAELLQSTPTAAQPDERAALEHIERASKWSGATPTPQKLAETAQEVAPTRVTVPLGIAGSAGAFEFLLHSDAQPDERAALPCPFCGNPPFCAEEMDADEWWYVACQTPGCVLPISGGHTSIEAAIAKWNRRAASQSTGLIEQHHRDSAELRSLCAARDEARRTAEYWKAEHNAANRRIGELEARAAAPQAGEMTDERRSVIGLLLDLARATHRALDDSEEGTGDDGRFHAIDGTNFDAMVDALDKLEELPDDKPGHTLDAPGKAEWALRALLAAAQGGNHG